MPRTVVGLGHSSRLRWGSKRAWQTSKRLIRTGRRGWRTVQTADVKPDRSHLPIWPAARPRPRLLRRYYIAFPTPPPPRHPHATPRCDVAWPTEMWKGRQTSTAGQPLGEEWPRRTTCASPPPDENSLVWTREPDAPLPVEALRNMWLSAEHRRAGGASGGERGGGASSSPLGNREAGSCRLPRTTQGEHGHLLWPRVLPPVWSAGRRPGLAAFGSTKKIAPAKDDE